MARNEKAAGTLSWLALALAALVLVGCERSVVDSAPVDISTVEVSTFGQSTRVGGDLGAALTDEHSDMAQEATAARRWFVDAIEGGAAVLIDEEGQVWAVDTSAIPTDAREGTIFVAMGTVPGAAPDCARERCQLDEAAVRALVAELAARRDRLVAGDQGETIHL